MGDHRGPGYRIHTEITVANQEPLVPGALKQQGAQGLLAVFERAHRAVQDAAGQAIEYPQDARQTPVGRFFAIAGPMWGEVLGNVRQGPQAAGRTVDQAHVQPEPFGCLDGGSSLSSRYCYFAANSWKVIQKFIQTLPTFQVVKQR